MSKPLATKVSTPQSENVQIESKVSVFCVATIICQLCLNTLGHGVHQSFIGCLLNPLPLLHDGIRELRLTMPHRCSIGFRSGDMLSQSNMVPVIHVHSLLDFSKQRMVWALTGWPPTPSTSAAMLAALIRLFSKDNLWTWSWAGALNFFGRPWRGLFWVEPVLLNRCMVLATALQLSFRVLAIFL